MWFISAWLLQRFYASLSDIKSEVETVLREGRQLVEDGCVEDQVTVSAQLDAMKALYNRVRETWSYISERTNAWSRRSLWLLTWSIALRYSWESRWPSPGKRLKGRCNSATNSTAIWTRWMTGWIIWKPRFTSAKESSPKTPTPKRKSPSTRYNWFFFSFKSAIEYLNFLYPSILVTVAFQPQC